MNKQLLLVPAVLFAFGAYAQTGKQAKPVAPINKAAAHRPILEEGASSHKLSAPKTPVKPVQQHAVSSAKTASIAPVSCTHFSGSANAFGFYQGGHESLCYDADLDAIAFTHRAAVNYSTVPNGNTGTIVNKWSMNHGSTWDSTVIWANTTDLGRYPQGGIYNPPGNTNINSAYAVGMGEAVVSGFDGTWWASKKFTTPGTLTAGTDQQFFSNVAPYASLGKKVDFPRYGFTYTKDGHVRALGEICNDINATTAPDYEGPRGAAILKGTFNAGAFIWSYDSIIPNTILRSDNSKQMTFELADMAWNDNGTVGYVMMLGARAGSTGSMKGYQPMVYKTTTSGATWTLMPQQDFTDPLCFKGLVNRLWPVNTGSLIVPFFTGAEGLDMAVDASDNLHLVTTVVGSYSTNNDSLEYTGSFGTEQYSWPYGSFGFPTIYDFYTVPGNGWKMLIVDSMETEGPSGTSGYPGYSYNTYASAGIGVDARIQVCHSPDRTKMFYSWGVTDTNLTLGLHWNSYPSLMMKGYDINTKKLTPRMNLTTGLTNADQSAFFHYMANRAIPVTGGYEIPFTISWNASSDGNSEMDHYYIKGATVNTSDFNVTPFTNPSCVTGISSPSKEALGFDAVAFPNPANGSATIALTLDAAKTADISICNMLGAEVYSTQIKGTAGTNNVNVDLSSLSRGVYMYTVKVGNASISKKLIVE